MAIYTWRTAATAHPEDSVLQFFTDLIKTGGVKDLTSDNHLKVTERGAGANMSVDIAAGRAFINKSGANCYPFRNTATVNVAVTNNVSGNPRIDSVVAYINLGASADSTASNVGAIAVVAGTPAGSPVAPDATAIGTAIGSSSYPYIVLANIAVANGAASITNANITDVRAPYKTVGKLTVQTATDAAPTNYDISLGNYIRHTLGANRTSTVTNVQVGDTFYVELTPSTYTMTWFSGITWAGGVTPVLTTAIDIFAFTCVSTGVYRGTIVGQGYA